MIQSKGRMLRRDIRKSEKFAALTKESQVLFCLMIPHFNAHGKMNGESGFIKGECCPLIKWLDDAQIHKSLSEITRKTNVKWFKFGKLSYIHALNWSEHQDFNEKRIGPDNLPSWNQSSHGLLNTSHGVLGSSPSEVKLSKDEVKLSESGTKTAATGPSPSGPLPPPSVKFKNICKHRVPKGICEECK